MADLVDGLRRVAAETAGSSHANADDRVYAKRALLCDADRRFLEALAPRARAQARMVTDYRISARHLAHWGALDRLKVMCQAKPKAKRVRIAGRTLPAPTWPLWRLEVEGEGAAQFAWFVLPRVMGRVLFGPPPPDQQQVWAGDALPVADWPPPPLPLLDAAGGRRLSKCDQQRAVAAALAALRAQVAAQGFGGVLFSLSPGFGKTCCAAHMVRALGRRALFVTPDAGLFTQVADEFRAVLGPQVRVGRMSTSNRRHWDIENTDVVLTTVKSAATIDYDLRGFGTVIVDEAHGTLSPAHARMYGRFGAQHVVALTATPERTDECGRYFQWLVGPIAWHEAKDVTATRWKTIDVTVYHVHHATRPKVEQTRFLAGEVALDYEASLQALLQCPLRNEHVLRAIADRVAQGGHVLALGRRVAHMQQVHHDLVHRLGIDSGLIMGKSNSKLTPEEEETAKTKRVVIMTTSKGYQALNVPTLTTLVMLDCISDSVPWLTQANGRITRELAGKARPEIVCWRDAMRCKLQPGSEGCFASKTDKACAALKRISSGYAITRVHVRL